MVLRLIWAKLWLDSYLDGFVSSMDYSPTILEDALYQILGSNY